MTLYRNRDIAPSKPWQTVLLYAVFYGISLWFVWPMVEKPLVFFIAGGITLFLILGHGVYQWSPARMRRANQFVIESHRQKQNRLTPAEAKEAGLQLTQAGLPLASLAPNPDQRQKEMVGLPTHQLEGHTLVVATTRAGKGMHLTRTLYQADCAMLVIDPKGEQYERTAGYRAQEVGPVYRIPGHTLDLACYFDLSHNDHLIELHFHLLRPWADKQPIFAEKCLDLFSAAHAYARDHGLNPVQVLLDVAKSAPGDALEALRQSDYDSVMNFTNGDEPDSLDKFAASAWGNFTTRMFGYQQHWHTLTQSHPVTSIPTDWAEQKGTIYITYPFDVLKGVGGAVSAMIAALMRYQKMHNRKDKILMAVDELPAVGLRNCAEYLATVGGYGISLLLYVQTYSQLIELYGREGAQTILSNCHHQVWYPPADMETAEQMSKLYGTTLKPFQAYSHTDEDKPLIPDLGNRERGRSVNMQVLPELSAEEMMALPKDAVILQMDRRYKLRAYRLWPVAEFEQKILPVPFEVEGVGERPLPPWKQKQEINNKNQQESTDGALFDPTL